MKKDYDEKYWNDYSEFIKTVEGLSGISPSNLLLQYEGLLEDVKSWNIENQDICKYELDYDFLIREDIQNVLNIESLKKNQFFLDFNKSVEEIDSKIKKYILFSDQQDWWKTSKLKLKTYNMR
ncbi:hypothetical protein FUAX_45130 (plasmid) [Fulvitalea axinellae]|uniref:Uncharacterized protein n=1 Tax=Fulvitalea axinellae TaxID=1182444 RepID=A0AAU9CIY7_9BACT|nr:hypothetical protein FUAX_45130 [Fulvitalea axinellae]